jgi:predicted dehydrogenase
MFSIKNLAKTTGRRLLYHPHAGHIGIGLIGVGGWGWVNACNIMKSRRFDIKGIYDKSVENSKNFKDVFKVKDYSSYEAMLRDKEIQAVVITTPNHTHYALVKEAADADKHIFVEKPLTSGADDCRFLGRYCKSKGVVLMVGHQLRREPAFRFIKQVIRDQELGSVLFARGIRTVQRKQIDWRNDPTICKSGAMEQLGVHIIDIFNNLFGEVKDAFGEVIDETTPTGPADRARLLLTYSANIHASVDVSFSSPNYLNLAIFGNKASVVTDGKYIYFRQAGKVNRIKPKGAKASVGQFEELADCIHKGTIPETGAEVSARAVEPLANMTREIL